MQPSVWTPPQIPERIRIILPWAPFAFLWERGTRTYSGLQIIADAFQCGYSDGRMQAYPFWSDHSPYLLRQLFSSEISWRLQCFLA